ncbi:MAG: adenosylcobinamide-phosphate synthase CbiB [Candidatus Electrothrix aestuarii]|uniref:Cobalamin biosynthesis protein CobD n=1 Tax=Candidatus Electrothrix aestuarii TaxID=3062594 RepID=A0AAU8LT59_9BACT|nr:adenosylcobinamide-phosphate synthase CbiB [Candidatus Electrothrix aestuarii]
MYFLSVLFFACLLDALFGDPRWFPHPVRLIGRFALAVELFTRKLPLDLYNSGRLAMLIILCGTGGVICTLLVLLSRAPQPVFFVGATFILYTTIAARDLIHHARQVVDALALDTLDITLARKRVGMIVGRDTDQLDTAGIVRACVESVAENMSDGIIAPLFWAVIGAVLGQIIVGLPVIWGVTAAMLYKAINTMDSMFGYKNERYLQFGSCPARLDDAVNFLPARLSGGALVLAASLCGCDVKNSFQVLIRDRRNHSSPNAGWPEAAMAGALRLQLGGTSSYFGELLRKPTIGDSLEIPQADHIIQANKLVVVASLLCLLLLSLCSFLPSIF